MLALKEMGHTRAVLTGGLVFALTSTAVSDVGATEVLRYTDTLPGAIAATGNALGLSKELDANGPGTEDSIGTFITQSNTVDNDPLNVGNPWPTGTTGHWTENGSSAVLNLPPDTSVLYAELVWGGSSYYFPEDVRSSLDDDITLWAGTANVTVSPDPATALTIETVSAQGFDANYYVRSADVTSFVDQHGAGTYVAAGIPATQSTGVDDLNAAGWSLIVAYRDESQPIRNLSIFVGGSWVDEYAQEDYVVDGFCAPPFGTVEGNIVVTALEGDADRPGDSLSIAPTVSDTFVRLSGPNNPVNNFFCSQINGSDGLVDTAGDFGNANHDAINGDNVAGGRQGWDVTTVEVSSQDGHLFNDQTAAVIRTNTTGDSYVPAAVALEIDVKSPDFTDGSTTQASMDLVTIGDSFTVTARLNNTGEAMASNLVLHLPIDGGLNLTGFTLDGTAGDIDGNSVTAADLASGVPVGDLDINTMLEVVLSVDVVGPPQSGDAFSFVPTWEHSFQMCDDGPTLSDTYTSQAVEVDYDYGTGTGGTGGGGTGLTGGTGGTGLSGGTGGGGLPANGDDPTEEGGCGCATPGSTTPLGGLAALALGLCGLTLRRRRRSTARPVR